MCISAAQLPGIQRVGDHKNEHCGSQPDAALVDNDAPEWMLCSTVHTGKLAPHPNSSITVPSMAVRSIQEMMSGGKPPKHPAGLCETRGNLIRPE